MTKRAHTLTIPGSIPAALLRVLFLIVAVAAVLVLNSEGHWRVIGAVLAVIAAAMPRAMTVWGVVGALVLGVLLSEPSMWRTMFAVLSIPLLVMLGGISYVAPLRSRIALRVFLPSARRLLLIQLVSQPVAVLAALVPALEGEGFSWLAPLGSAVLIGIAIFLSRAIRARSAAGQR